MKTFVKYILFFFLFTLKVHAEEYVPSKDSLRMCDSDGKIYPCTFYHAPFAKTPRGDKERRMITACSKGKAVECEGLARYYYHHQLFLPRGVDLLDLILSYKRLACYYGYTLSCIELAKHYEESKKLYESKNFGMLSCNRLKNNKLKIYDEKIKAMCNHYIEMKDE